MKKQKPLTEIKHGQRVCDRLTCLYPVTYNDIVRDLGLDSKVAQKVLADLQKHGYISKNERGFYHVLERNRDEKANTTRP